MWSTSAWLATARACLSTSSRAAPDRARRRAEKTAHVQPISQWSRVRASTRASANVYCLTPELCGPFHGRSKTWRFSRSHDVEFRLSTMATRYALAPMSGIVISGLSSGHVRTRSGQGTRPCP
jgi:hypothetical protein